MRVDPNSLINLKEFPKDKQDKIIQKVEQKWEVQVVIEDDQYFIKGQNIVQALSYFKKLVTHTKLTT